MNPGGPVITLENIVKSYQMGEEPVEVLKNVSMEIKYGEFLAILGPSGSGKTTLMNIIGCIDIADSGSYCLGGTNILAHSEDELSEIRNQKIGFVFQKFNLITRFNALHNVALPLFFRGMEKEEAYSAAAKTLISVGLRDRMLHKPNELSGGQQQRVAIARALVGGPDIILADEPTGALDSSTGHEIMGLFQEMNNRGITIILITHDHEVALKAGRTVNILDGILT